MAAKQLKNGFTLLELLIVTGLSTMLLLTISAMFMTFLASGASTNIRRTLNREGSYAINQLEYIFRNSRSLSCDEPGQTITVTGNDMVQSTISIQNVGGVNRIASQSAQHGIHYLNSESISVDSNFLGCEPIGDKTYVDINLTMQKIDDSGTEIGEPEIFSTSVQVRN